MMMLSCPICSLHQDQQMQDRYEIFGTICGSYAIILIQHLCWAGFCWTAGVIVQVRLNSQLPKHPPGVGLCSRPAAWCNGTQCDRVYAIAFGEGHNICIFI